MAVCEICGDRFRRSVHAHDLDPDICDDCEDIEIERHVEAKEWTDSHAEHPQRREG